MLWTKIKVVLTEKGIIVVGHSTVEISLQVIGQELMARTTLTDVVRKIVR